MTAQIYQIRDYQSKADIERMQRELEKEAASILDLVRLNETAVYETSMTVGVIPYGGKGIDGMPWLPDDGPLSGYKDPA